MKHFIQTIAYGMAAAISLSLSSCAHSMESDIEQPIDASQKELVTINAHLFDFSQEQTRAALSDPQAQNVKALSLYIYDTSNEEVAYNEHRFRKDYGSATKSLSDFGSYTFYLKAGTYRVVLVGYDSESEAATFNASDRVTMPTPLMETYSFSDVITVLSAGTNSYAADLKPASTYLEITSTDLPSPDAQAVRITASSGSLTVFDPISQASITSDGESDGVSITASVANNRDDEGHFHIKKPFFIPTAQKDITITLSILDRTSSDATPLRSYEIGTYSFKRGYIDKLKGSVFATTNSFSVSVTADWETNVEETF